MSTRALIFDLGKVLIEFSVDLACAQVAAVAGTTPEQVQSFLYHSGLEHRFESGDIDFAELHALFQTQTGRHFPLAQLRRACAEIFLPMDESMALIRFLHASRQTPLILLSNTNHVHWDYICEQFGIHNFFDAHILSFRERVMKPDPKIYQAAVTAAQCAPAECFFVDDLAINVEGALAAGLDSVQFTSVQKLRADLLKRGLRVE